MKIGILIPTYEKHLSFNFAFIESLIQNAEGPIPSIYFATSTKAEAEKIDQFLKQKKSPFVKDIQCLSMNSEMEEFNKLKSQDLSDALNLNRGLAYVNYKKLAGVDRLFGLGFSDVFIFDSEVLFFRKGNLLKSLSEAAQKRVYRYSHVAYETPTMAKIQHDSCRSVIADYPPNHLFTNSYGWFDNFCHFEKETFQKFINFFSRSSEDLNLIKIQNFIQQSRSHMFEWLSYMAFAILVDKQVFDFVDLDAKIFSILKSTPQRLPITENLSDLLSGNKAINSLLLRELDPPWIPALDNPAHLALAKEALSPSCCLMFHLDRGSRKISISLPSKIARKIKSILSELTSLWRNN